MLVRGIKRSVVFALAVYEKLFMREPETDNANSGGMCSAALLENGPSKYNITATDLNTASSYNSLFLWEHYSKFLG